MYTTASLPALHNGSRQHGSCTVAMPSLTCMGKVQGARCKVQEQEQEREREQLVTAVNWISRGANHILMLSSTRYLPAISYRHRLL
jgi:hypothetical protein